ncbi:MAG: hypothetical protein DSY37_04430 [Hyperthermus sp.]|nr:MAG: hypothetical protein DSY37_04430 [Hyperthermus sp.]
MASSARECLSTPGEEELKKKPVGEACSERRASDTARPSARLAAVSQSIINGLEFLRGGRHGLPEVW